MSSSRVGSEYLSVLLPIQGAALAVSKATMRCGTATVAQGHPFNIFLRLGSGTPSPEQLPVWGHVLAVKIPTMPCWLHMGAQLTLDLGNASIIKGSSDGWGLQPVTWQHHIAGQVLGGPCAVAPLVYCLDPKGGHHIATAQLCWYQWGWAGSSPGFIFFLNLCVYSSMSEQLKLPCHKVLIKLVTRPAACVHRSSLI